jgi:hypothetical protein
MGIFTKKSSSESMSEAEWEARTDATLAWVRRSIAACPTGGSAHSYSPLRGWSKAYPETTGYLIETLLAYAKVKQDDSLRQLAQDCQQWLVSIQLSSGAWPGLLAGHQQASIFNTGQILFGFTDLPHSAAQSAAAWLLSELSEEDAWNAHAYVPGFEPTYYTRVIWPILLHRHHFQKPLVVEDTMRRVLYRYAERFLPNHALRDVGFWPGKAAFTHTLAYALEGFWESASILNETAIQNQVLRCADQLLYIRAQHGHRTAGRYDEAWRGDYSFRCVPGNLQLSILFFRLYACTREKRYEVAGVSFLKEVLRTPTLVSGAGKGGVAGSAPFWGPYLRFRYPNWGAKFFLDAMLWYREGV